jgi:hypothetical protein
MAFPRCVSISNDASDANEQIKHVDDHTGQIKENVWEFTHPNFQAGGKADLDSIKVWSLSLTTEP